MFRYVTPVTRVPSVTRSVTAARWASVVQLSSMSCHGGPNIGIWRKWSMSHTLVNPASSASIAMRRNPGPSAAVDPAQANDGIWRPNRSCGAGSLIGAVGPSATAGSAVDPPCRRPGAGSTPTCTSMSKPSASTAAATAAWARSWRSSTATGTGSRRARLRARHSAGAMSNTTTIAAIRCRRARSSQRARRSASLPSVSITVVSRRPTRRSTANSSSSKASALAATSRSPSPTSARRASADTTRSRPKRSAAHVVLPAPDGPTSTITAGDGIAVASPDALIVDHSGRPSAQVGTC